MQTRLDASLLDERRLEEAERILRACVHCGFCTATCPTYQLTGDELDGPRGRIYLIKAMLEGQSVSERTRHHLDRCLTCRSCETTCPSGVGYHRLLEIGRSVVEARVPRGTRERLVRAALRRLLPEAGLFGPLARLAGWARPLLPTPLRRRVPSVRGARDWPAAGRSRRVILLEGCAQKALRGDTNAALARVLDRLGITVARPEGQGCCGAVEQHLQAEEEARRRMIRNLEAWWPEVEAGAEAIVVAASACGLQVKEYGELLAGDPRWAERGRQVATLARDPLELLESLDLAPLGRAAGERVAFHAPCTLRHGQGLAGRVERLLERVGYRTVPVADAHLCCGSAGTYSLLQPELSRELQRRRCDALSAEGPDLYATANIGCQLHLEEGLGRPVHHWIELLDRLAGAD